MRTVAAVFAAAAICVTAAPAAAQSDRQNEEILNELRQIRQLLERIAAPPSAARPAVEMTPAKLTGLGGFAQGRADAPLVMIEFSDLQCPFCRKFHLETYEQLKTQYIATGKLLYIVRDFPLTDIHPLAKTAAEAARCAAGQGRYWDMRHAILANNQALTADSFAEFARTLKLDPAAFGTCMRGADKTFDDELKSDAAAATALGVDGTPAFVLGKRTPDGVDGVRVVGAQPFAVFDGKLKELLAAAPASK